MKLPTPTQVADAPVRASIGTTSQRQILEAIRDRCHSAGFTFVNDGGWANTGNVSAVARGEITSDRRLSYDFQGDSASFKIHGGINRGKRVASTEYGAAATEDLVAKVVAYITSLEETE